VIESDVVIDATVSNAVTAALDAIAHNPGRRAVIAQVATDVASGTLGMLAVSTPDSSLAPSQLDEIVGRLAKGDPDLELYHGLWRDPLAGDELVPTRGCSVPTFHGSAADLTAVAGVLTSLLGAHLAATSDTVGVHLIALPHAAAGPRHKFVTSPAAGAEAGVAA
jgi:hypothetical protein